MDNAIQLSREHYVLDQVHSQRHGERLETDAYGEIAVAPISPEELAWAERILDSEEKQLLRR